MRALLPSFVRCYRPSLLIVRLPKPHVHVHVVCSVEQYCNMIVRKMLTDIRASATAVASGNCLLAVGFHVPS